MQNRSSPFLQQDRNLLIFLVVVGYIATFITSARGTTEFSAFQIVTGILFGVIYLVLALFDEELLRRFSGNTRHIIYFSVQIALVFGIGWMLGPGGNWLMGLPLASVAVVRLSPRGRWPVYLGIVASFVLPILRYSTWDAALMNGLVISAGIFFSVLVSQMRLNEQRAAPLPGPRDRAGRPPLRGRSHAPRHAARRGGVLAAPAREGEGHRRVGREGAAGRALRGHRRRRAGPALVRAAVRRLAGLRRGGRGGSLRR